MTLKNFALDDGDDQSLKSVSEIGSMLFTRGVSGTRVITGRDEKIFQGNHVFKGNKIVYWLLGIFLENNSAHIFDSFSDIYFYYRLGVTL